MLADLKVYCTLHVCPSVCLSVCLFVLVSVCVYLYVYVQIVGKDVICTRYICWFSLIF